MPTIRTLSVRSLIALAVPLLLAIVAVAALPAHAADQSVSIQNFAFPATINVNVGDSVTWTNQDSAAHTVTSDTAGVFGSGQLAQGQSFSHTFTQAGTFTYHCAIHPTMTGSVVVAAASGGGATQTATSSATAAGTSTATAQPPATGSGLYGDSGTSWAPIAIVIGALALAGGATSLVVVRSRSK
jgi:plastocyanin